MTMKIAVAALALAVLPAAGFAMCSGSKSHQAMSCAEGTAYDAASGTCVPQANT